MTKNAIEKLKARLLGLGGERVLVVPEPDLHALGEHGRVFEAARRRKVKGVRYQCRQNVALHYLARHLFGRGEWAIATGYSLVEGVWCPHAWLWDAVRVVETTEGHEAYFGVVLTDVEAAAFVLRAAMQIAPRGNEVLLSRAA